MILLARKIPASLNSVLALPRDLTRAIISERFIRAG